MLDRGRQHDVGVRERRTSVTGDDDHVGGVEGLARADHVEDVAEQASAQHQNRGLLTGTNGVQLGQCVAPDAFCVIAASGAKLRSESHVERAHHVRATKGRKERGPWELRRQESYRVLDDLGRLREIRSTDHEDHALAVVADELACIVEFALTEDDAQRERAVTERLGDEMCLPWSNRQRDARDRAQGAGAECQFNDRTLVAHGALTQTKKENRKFFAKVAGQRHDDASLRGLVDRRARERLDEGSVKTIAVLGVDVVGAQHAAQHPLPREGTLIGQGRPANGAESVGRRRGPSQQFGRLTERFAPTHRDEVAVSPNERFGDARRRVQRVRRLLVAVNRFQREAALVTQPPVIHRLAVDAQHARQSIARGLHRDTTAHGTRRAGALDLFQVPRSRVEAIGLGGQRADRADLHRVAREDRVEGLGRRGRHLDEVTATGKGDLGVTGHVGGEPRAARALDAPLAVQQNQRTDLDGLHEVTLLLDEARLSRAVRQRLVLQRALAALVTDRAVERVIREQEFENTILGLLDLFGVSDDVHAVVDLQVTGGLQGRAAR